MVSALGRFGHAELFLEARKQRGHVELVNYLATLFLPKRSLLHLDSRSFLGCLWDQDVRSLSVMRI